ncbi:MAG: hypothetical protein NC905_07405 [Candidatus Omnitrophica bacterium]|nr:hypothetical protein [Candidatus Omnitrophota bacterium]
MRFIRVIGKPYEIGYQIGNAYREEIQRGYEFFCLQRRRTFEKIDTSIFLIQKNTSLKSAKRWKVLQKVQE